MKNIKFEKNDGKKGGFKAVYSKSGKICVCGRTVEYEEGDIAFTTNCPEAFGNGEFVATKRENCYVPWHITVLAEEEEEKRDVFYETVLITGDVVIVASICGNTVSNSVVGNVFMTAMGCGTNKLWCSIAENAHIVNSTIKHSTIKYCTMESSTVKNVCYDFSSAIKKRLSSSVVKNGLTFGGNAYWSHLVNVSSGLMNYAVYNEAADVCLADKYFVSKNGNKYTAEEIMEKFGLNKAIIEEVVKKNIEALEAEDLLLFDKEILPIVVYIFACAKAQGELSSLLQRIGKMDIIKGKIIINKGVVTSDCLAKILYNAIEFEGRNFDYSNLAVVQTVGEFAFETDLEKITKKVSH